MLHEDKRVYGIKSDVRYRAVGSEGIILRQKIGDVLVINEIASRILEGIDLDLDVSSIIDDIYQEYEIDKEQVASDVDVLLGEFERLGIVEAK